MTGVGGGSLMTPILVLFFGVKPSLAVGTDLLYAAITKSGGIWVHGRKGTIDWPVVRWMSAGSIPAAIVTLLVLRHLNSQGIDYQRAITSALGLALVLTSLAIIFRGQVIKFAKSPRFAHLGPSYERLKFPLVTVCGLVLGILVTLSSVGAGALGTVMLFFLFPQWEARRIVGTDLAHAVPLTLIGGLGHAQLGSVDYMMLGSLLVGSLPGIYLGSHTGVKLPDGFVRPALAAMLLFVGLKFAAPVFAALH